MFTPGKVPASSSQWAIRVFPLVLGTFAIGSEGLIIAGILPAIAHGLDVSVSSAGQLVTIFALAYAVLGPVLAPASMRFPVRSVLVWSLSVFTLGCVLAALAPSYGVMAAIRVLVAVVGAFAVLGTVALVPTIGLPPKITPLQVVQLLRRPSVVLILMISLLMVAGDWVFYIYIAPFILLLTHGGNPAVAVALFLIGVSAVAGMALGGVCADRFGVHRTFLVSVGFLLLALFSLWALSIRSITPISELLATLALLIWGGAGFSGVIPLQSLLMSTAEEQGTVALALNYSASLLGMAVGGVVGGLVVSYRIQFLSLAEGVCVGLALAMYLVQNHAVSSVKTG